MKEVTEQTAQAEASDVLCPKCNHAIPLSVIKTSGASARSPRSMTYHLEGSADDRKKLAAKMPPQAKTCLAILEALGTDEISEADAMKAVADRKDELRTRQDPWRIFQYYRPRLNEAGIITVK